MKSRKKLLTILSLLAGLTLSSSAFADTPPNILAGTWSNDAPHKVQHSPQIENKEIVAKVYDKSGKVTQVTPRKMTQVSPNDFISGGYQYLWDHYNQSSYSEDSTHYYIGKVTAYNGTTNNSTLAYQQANTITSTWSTTGKVGSDYSFGDAVIGQAKISVGFDVGRSHTDQASTTTTYTITVSPGKTGEIDAYRYGVYSSGTGYWQMYDEYGSYLGMYSETGSAWTVGNNAVHYNGYQY